MEEREKLSEQRAGQKFLQGELQLQVCGTINNTIIMSFAPKNPNHGQEEISGDPSRVTGGFQFGVGSSIVTVACSC